MNPRPSLAVRLWAGLVVPFLLLSPGCGRPSGEGDGRVKRSGARLAPDHLFSGPGEVEVLEVQCRLRPEFVGSEVSGHETPEAQARRAKRVARATLASRIWIHPERLVWELPTFGRPASKAYRMHLVLKPASEVAALVDHGGRRYWADRPAQLAAWLEGALRPLAALSHVEVLSRVRADVPAGLRGGGYDEQHLGHVQARLVLASPPGRRPAGPQYDVEAWSLTSAALPPLGNELLWDLALLPFAQTVGSRPLALLRPPAAWPVYVGLTVKREGERLSAPAPRWFLVLDVASGRRRKVPSEILRLPPPGFQRMFGPVTYRDGHALSSTPVEPPRERQKGEPRSGTLALKNPGGHFALVYADAVPAAFVGPRSRYALGTLAPGYYRLAAFSLFGTTRFGPRDLYVPGGLTLGAD
jgi:hypothetical protein